MQLSPWKVIQAHPEYYVASWEIAIFMDAAVCPLCWRNYKWDSFWEARHGANRVVTSDIMRAALGARLLISSG